MAITTAKDIILLKMPSLVGPPEDPRIGDFVELAKFRISEIIFVGKYQYALALVVLHQLTLDAQSGGTATTSGSGAAGGIKSEKEGDLSVTYHDASGSFSANKSYWAGTSFGQELLSLWNACILGPRNRFVSGR